MFKTTRNISTAFWHILTCPHKLRICVVPPLSNLFQWWFVVFQRYLMIDVPFTVIFPWHAFCELLFNVFFKRLYIASKVLFRAHFFFVFQGSINAVPYDPSKVSRGIAIFALYFILLCSQIWPPPESLNCDPCLRCLHLLCCLDFLQMSKHCTQHC